MRKVENLLLIAFLAALLTYPFFSYSHIDSLDLHIHDTYFVIAYAGLAKYLLLFPVLLFILYKLVRKKQGAVSGWIWWAHILITVLFMLYISSVFIAQTGMPRRYFDYSNGDSFNRYQFTQMITALGVLSFLLAQLLFLVYFIITMSRPKRLSL